MLAVCMTLITLTYGPSALLLPHPVSVKLAIKHTHNNNAINFLPIKSSILMLLHTRS